jgi:orotidine-5'-phosphate decarboxylase
MRSETEISSRSKWAQRVMVALDYPSSDQAEETLAALDGTGCYIKVGMELFYTAGPKFIMSLKERGYRVFLDIKLHDIPNTVKGAAKSVTRLGVDMFNVHAGGGRDMMEAARDGVEAACSASSSAPIVIGVTQLTSTDERILNKEIGIPGTVEETVLRYAKMTRQAGLQGVVCSPLEVPMLKKEIGSEWITVTPGIRPAQASVGDQKRVASPHQAIELGADYLVIGRPITQASDVRAAFETILDEMVAV